MSIAESNVNLYATVFPATFSRASGAEVFSAEGGRWIDFFCGAGALNLGHNQPDVVRQVAAHLQAGGILHALDADTVAKKAFMQTFDDVVLRPSGLEYRVQFTGPSGADAIEAALRLAWKIHGRPGVVAFKGAFHGMTLGAAGVSAIRPGSGFRRGLADVTWLPFPRRSEDVQDRLTDFETRLDAELGGDNRPAAVIVEPVQFDGGLWTAPLDWLRGLRELTRRHDILLICDEVQCGCGRTSAYFAFQAFNIVPDIVVVSKSISGLGLPLALCLIRPAHDAWSPGEHTGTFRANQLALVAAEAALRVWSSEPVRTASARTSARLAAFGRDAAGRDPLLTVRSAGVALGIESAQSGWARRAQHAAFAAGVLTEVCGEHGEVLKVCPPVNIAAAVLEEGLAALWSALEVAAAP